MIWLLTQNYHYLRIKLDWMKEFVISTTKKETAILVGLITSTQNERKTNEYLDEL